MFVLQKSKTKASARGQIAIKRVQNGIIELPNHTYRAVLEVSSINFELKSEDEQDAIIETYESFLNSVGTGLQILIRTREIDMDNYLADLEARKATETEAVYRQQLENYDEFIRSLISTNKILARHFYVVVPFEGGHKLDFEMISEHLALKVDIVSKGLTRLGMHARQLYDLELLDLFYSFYSPAQAKVQPLTDKALQLLHTALIEKGENDA